MRSVVVKVRVSPVEAEHWRQAAGGGGVSELVRVAVDRELERRREEAELEAAAVDVDADPLAELLAEYVED